MADQPVTTPVPEGTPPAQPVTPPVVPETPPVVPPVEAEPNLVDTLDAMLEKSGEDTSPLLATLKIIEKSLGEIRTEITKLKGDTSELKLALPKVAQIVEKSLQGTVMKYMEKSLPERRAINEALNQQTPTPPPAKSAFGGTMKFFDGKGN